MSWVSAETLGYDKEYIANKCDELLNDANDETCNDCGTKSGEYHKSGCDNDICMNCFEQVIQCVCNNQKRNEFDGKPTGTQWCYDNKKIVFDKGFFNCWSFDYNLYYITKQMEGK